MGTPLGPKYIPYANMDPLGTRNPPPTKQEPFPRSLGSSAAGQWTLAAPNSASTVLAEGNDIVSGV